MHVRCNVCFILLPLMKGEIRYHEPPENFKHDFCFFGALRGAREQVLDSLKTSIIASNFTYKFGAGENSDD